MPQAGYTSMVLNVTAYRYYISVAFAFKINTLERLDCINISSVGLEELPLNLYPLQDQGSRTSIPRSGNRERHYQHKMIFIFPTPFSSH